MKKKRAISFLANSALVLFSIIIAIIVIDLVWNVIDYLKSDHYSIPTTIEGLSYELIPQYTFTNQFGITEKLNSSGYRDIERSLIPKQHMRIVVLGDSVVYGDGVNNVDTFSAKLDVILGDIEVWNMGVSGYSVHDYLALTKNRVLPIKPDLVLLGITLNDHVYKNKIIRYGKAHRLTYSDTPDIGGNRLLKVALSIYRKSKVLKKLVQISNVRSKVVNTFFKRKEQYRAEIINFNLPETVSAGLIEYSKVNRVPIEKLYNYYSQSIDYRQWDRALQDITEIRDVLHANNVNLLVLVFPISYQRVPHYEAPQPNKYIKEFLNAHEIKALDISDCLELGNDLIDKDYLKIVKNGEQDCFHFSPEGHTRVATWLNQYLSHNYIWVQ